MPTLYHYSPLVHLAPIVAEGLTIGEIAQPNRYNRESAISLTSQTDPDKLMCWGASFSMKPAVRYVCRLPDGDKRLEATRDAWKRLNIPKAFRDILDPQGQAKWWWFWHGVIPPDLFTVELRGRDGYKAVEGRDLKRVAGEVAAVRERLRFEPHPDAPSILIIHVKDENDDEALAVLDEVYPADKYGIDTLK